MGTDNSIWSHEVGLSPGSAPHERPSHLIFLNLENNNASPLPQLPGLL